MKFNFNAKIEKIEDILNNFLPEIYNDEWINANFSSLPNGIKPCHFDVLEKPCRTLMLSGGKRWRPLFMVLCSELENAKCDIAYKLTPIVEMVHTASLIHDDIEDGAQTRRGKPATHIEYGIDVSINAASWLYFTAFSAIDQNVKDTKLKNEFYALLATHIRRLHLGQAMDIFWHRNPKIIPTQEEYSAMVRLKTGTLASLASECGVMASFSENAHEYDEHRGQIQNLGEIAMQIGEGFQVLDDVINITTGNKGKKRGDDIVEGKKSLPLIFHLQEKPGDKDEIIANFEIAAKDGIESPVIEKTIQLINTSNAIVRAKKYAENLIKSSCHEIIALYNGNEASLQIEEMFVSML